MKKIIKSTPLLIALFTGQAAAMTGGYDSDIFVIGDSYSSSGNLDFLSQGGFPGPFYSEGRFADEFTYVDYFALEATGEVLTPSYAGGTNYAFGGATTSSHLGFLESALVPQALFSQLAPFATGGTQQTEILIQSTSGSLDSEAIYIVDIGTNNLTFAAERSVSIIQDSLALNEWKDTVLDIALNDTRNIVNDLYDAGAENIVLSNSFDVGLLPFVNFLDANVPGVGDFATSITEDFNLGLLNLSSELFADILLLDVFDIVNNFSLNTDVSATGKCFDGVASICSNPENYLFWDDLHITSATHRQISNSLYSSYASVPEPPMMLMLLTGMIFLSPSFSRRFQSKK